MCSQQRNALVYVCVYYPSLIQPLQINVANSSKIEFYRRAKKRFLPLVWAILSFFSAFILKLCFLFNNLPSNVRKVPPKSFDGQKMALH